MNVATPQSQLIEGLLDLGWSVKKIELKNGFYVARGYNDSTGQEFDAKGQDPEMATAALYRYAINANAVRRHAARKFSAWDTDWLDRREQMAQAYSKLPHFDEKAATAWKALAAESKIQADAIRQQIKVDVVDDPEPYLTAKEMQDDIHKNKHLSVSRASSDHPLWSEEDNVNFRIVHDVLGHAQSGGDYSWHGENKATAAHMPLVSPLAREALMTEALGHAAYRSHFKGNGPKKIGFLSEFLHPVQERNGEHVWVPHGAIPQLQQPSGQDGAIPGATPNLTGPGQWVSPQQLIPSPVMQGPPGVMEGFSKPSAKMVSPDRPADPNQFWVPEDQATPINPSENPQGDYIDLVSAARNAAKIDTGWADEGEDAQRRAIMNAFRVAILSPRKHIKWNAAHYQAIMNADPGTPAVELWNMLEENRERHNQGLGYPEGSHLSYKHQLDFLTHELQTDDPSLGAADARREAKEIVFRKTKEFEAQIGAQQDDLSELKRSNMARKLVAQWLQENYTPARGWQQGQMALAASDWSTPQLFDTPQQTSDGTGFANDESKYGAFMGAHLDAVAEVGQHVDEIRDLALKDLQDGGRGFLFRNGVMNMNLPGVNPKVASFAWLLLAPTSSELGIIDTHIARGLRRPIDTVTPRDYYKLERMQRAMKDATGYGHVPLGLYHWGMWDMIRNPGEHSDHSPLRVLDPLPWDSPEAKWDAGTTGHSGYDYAGPIAFEHGRGAAEKAAIGFDSEFANSRPNEVPLVQPPGLGTPVPPQGLHIIPATAMVRPQRA